MGKRAEKEIPRFSDIYISEWKTKGNIGDLRGKEVVIKKVEFVQGALGEVALLDVETEDGNFRVHTFSKVIIKQLKSITDKLPIRATIKKVKSYYTLA